MLFPIACNHKRAVFAEQIGQWQIAFLVSVSIELENSFADSFLTFICPVCHVWPCPSSTLPMLPMSLMLSLPHSRQERD